MKKVVLTTIVTLGLRIRFYTRWE